MRPSTRRLTAPEAAGEQAMGANWTEISRTESVASDSGALICNDTHSKLNATSMRGRLQPTTVEDVVAAVRAVRQQGHYMSVCGSCHAMGGQQFASGGWLL